MNLCNGCTKCCYGILPLSEKDYNNIPDNLKFYAIPIINAENKYSYILSETTKYIIDTPDNSPCPFLQNNECSIYENRPEICKIFPSSFHYSKSNMKQWLKENCNLYLEV